MKKMKAAVMMTKMTAATQTKMRRTRRCLTRMRKTKKVTQKREVAMRMIQNQVRRALTMGEAYLGMITDHFVKGSAYS